MKPNLFFWVAGSLLGLALSAPAATRYVNLNNPTPTAPYTNWAAAATNIQDAVDAAGAGDEIVVTNGVYQTGARVVDGMSNRVAVIKPVTVRSVNGPEATSIVGYRDPGTTNGPAVVRCVYLTTGAVLAGFTLTNGATQTDGDYDENQSGGGVCCVGLSAVVSNCVLTGNSASWYGGGAFGGTLNNCTLTGNSASYGGGAYSGTLNNCTLTGNSAQYGGGASWGTLNSCTLTGNSASWYGGGAYWGTLNNCTLTGNSASYTGGGAYQGTLNNCTLTGNSASSYGGGASGGTLNNCIVYYNTAPSGGNYDSATLNYCCTTPLPTGGTGNRTDEPQLVSTSHLSAGSPCRGRGSGDYAVGVDLDGEPWANPPAIGCDEYWSGSVTGALSVAMGVSHTNVAVGFGVDFQALIGGRVSASRWDFGDGGVLSNRPYATHAWEAAGEYVVELRAYNESDPVGVAATVLVHVQAQPVHYVALDSANPVPPYSSWATAATNVQDAVDAATLPGALVWVTNGMYQTGARAVDGMSNRVAVTKPVTVRSVNGPAATSIVGYRKPGTTTGPAVRCVYLTNGAVLAGFTLTNGATQTSGDYVKNRSGGGVWCAGLSAVVSNCVFTGNLAYDSGGGAYRGTLNNCTLTGNSSTFGGGAYWGTLNNCIVYYNNAASGGNYNSATLNYCFTTPLPGGTSNFTNAPLFVNTNGWSNLRLQSNSPCINAGNNACAPGPSDLDGNPRISGGTVDVGAYEFPFVVPAPPTVTLQSVAGPWIHFALGGEAGVSCTVQTTTNLSAGASWEPFLSLTLTNGLGAFDWTNSGEPHRFFRVLRP